MNRPVGAARGQPLLVLGAILGSWVLARALMISSGATATAPELALLAANPDTLAPLAQPVAALATQSSAQVSEEQDAPVPAVSPQRSPAMPAPAAPVPGSGLVPASGDVTPLRPPAPPVPPPPVADRAVPVPPVVAVAHQLLWMAALAPPPTSESASQPPRSEP